MRSVSGSGRLIGIGIGLLILIIVVISTLSASVVQVRPGYAAVKLNIASHNTQTQTLQPGVYFINPITDRVAEYPISIQSLVMSTRSNEGKIQGDDSIHVQSAEGQQLNLDATLNWSIDVSKPDNVSKLYLQWAGLPLQSPDQNNIEDKVVRPLIRAVGPRVVALYGYEDVIGSKRGEVENKIIQQAQEELNRNFLRLDSFQLREVHLPQQLQDAINGKIQAQQKLEQAKIEAQTQVTQAEAAKKAAILKAEGDAQATLIAAEAAAKSNNLINASLSPAVIQNNAIQKLNPNVQVVVVPANGSQILGLDKFLRAQ